MSLGLFGTRRRVAALEARACVHRAVAARAARDTRDALRRKLTSVEALSLAFVSGLAWGAWSPRPRRLSPAAVVPGGGFLSRLIGRLALPTLLRSLLGGAGAVAAGSVGSRGSHVG